mmetsp:Transcript_91410/g.263169  ORF Transcript_91410/g.263169 Transcript_91410/m.263169 type:complete len:225 (+) Transcript_91410:75-749(+)
MAVPDIVEDGSTLLALEAAECPASPANQFHRRSVVVAVAAAAAIGAMAVVAGLAGHILRPVAASPGDDLELWGQQQCSSCNGGCNCDWANEASCATDTHDESCCWTCCCGQVSSVNPVFVHHHHHHVYHYSEYPHEVASCNLHHGDWVHVTGFSGRSYSATVVGWVGDDVFEVEISGHSYRVHSHAIDLCTIGPNYFLTTVLPILLIIVVVAAVLYILLKGKKS